jgi:hypothetical protein
MVTKLNAAKAKKPQIQEKRVRISQLLLALPKLLEEASDECFGLCVDEAWPELEWYHLSRLLQDAGKLLQSTLEDFEKENAVPVSSGVGHERLPAVHAGTA